MFCHAREGKGTRLNEGGTMTPPLAGSPRVLGSKEISINILLHGMTGKVDGVNYEKDEVAMKPPPEMMANDDAIMAGLLNYIRNSWGNEAPMITPEYVKAAREAGKGRKEPWTVEELEKAFPTKKEAAVKKLPENSPISQTGSDQTSTSCGIDGFRITAVAYAADHSADFAHCSSKLSQFL